MDAWQRERHAGAIMFLPDSDACFTTAMGMLVNKAEVGLGKRSWRYSTLVNDGRIEKMFIEPDWGGDPFEVSDADTMLSYLDPSRSMGAVTMFVRPGCPFCARAVKLLEERAIPHERIDLDSAITMSSVRAATGAAKVPQVFIAGRLIGGSDELQRFVDQRAQKSAK